MAQVDSTIISSTTVSIFSEFWDKILSFLSSNLSVGVLTIIWLIVKISDKYIQASKWTPANDVLEAVWIAVKAIWHFIAGAKK